ncbi:MAG TPA: glycosyltransferase [Draconibacterium sp.]|nr:glycosyltransferase [Draconibacterium sp.]
MKKTIVVIPCYNESNRIDIRKFDNFLLNNPSITLFFVDDGSTDNTINTLSEFQNKHNNAISYQITPNSGKAEAIRKSVLYILEVYNYQYIGYFDADLSTSLEYIPRFQNKLEQSKTLKAVIGSRIKRLGSTITRNAIRHYSGRVVATFASGILKLPVYDTQCGAKLFQVEFIKEIFHKPFYSKWLFDIEIFKRLNTIYGIDLVSKSIYEYPLEEWIDDGDSRIKLKDFIKVPLDLYKIFMKY